MKRKAKVLHICCGTPTYTGVPTQETPQHPTIIEYPHGQTLTGQTDSVWAFVISSLGFRIPISELSSSSLPVRDLHEHVNSIKLNGPGASTLTSARLTQSFILLATGIASLHSLCLFQQKLQPSQWQETNLRFFREKYFRQTPLSNP